MKESPTWAFLIPKYLHIYLPNVPMSVMKMMLFRHYPEDKQLSWIVSVFKELLVGNFVESSAQKSCENVGINFLERDFHIVENFVRVFPQEVSRMIR